MLSRRPYELTMVKWPIFLMILLACLFDGNDAVIRPSSMLSIINGEGFIAYLEVPKDFGKIKNCWFKFRDDPDMVRIDLHSTKPLITERGETLLPFSANICGVRVSKLSTASAAVWSLKAENEFGSSEFGTLTVKVLSPQKTRFDTRLQREIGEGSISCSKHDYTKHCKIIEDNGDVTNSCELLTTILPNRTFECLTYNWGRMEESHEFISIDVQNSSLNTISTLEETETSIIIRCEFKESVQSCQAEMPDHKTEIYITDGLYNERYSTFDTNIRQSRCSLEIPKPLDDKSKGLWRIMGGSQSGCMFYVGGDKSDIIKKELETMQKLKIMKLYLPENGNKDSINKLSCTVPYVISDCYLKDPNNTIYFPDTYRLQAQGLFGKCEFIGLPIIAGIWTCGARGRDYEKEVLQEIEVIVKSRAGEVITEELKAKRKDNLELMCTSSYEEPLTHCAYTDPEGRVHLVGTEHSLKTAGHVQYFGRGLLYGECGAKITGVTENDFGEWKCQFVHYSRSPISTFKINLKESATAQASSVGLGIGITVIIVLVLGVIVGTVFYRRRNLSARHNFPSSDPLDGSPRIETTSA